jgi:hypothetical protein
MIQKLTMAKSGKSKKTSLSFLKVLYAPLILLALNVNTSFADKTPPKNHPAADAVRAIAELFYTPFEDYPFTDGGLCIDTGVFQVLINVYLRSPDGATAPTLQKICIDRPSDGELSIHWELGPTDNAKLFVLAGENEDIVKSHDFWEVGIPSELMSSKKLKLDELIFEREGGIDLKINGNNARIEIKGVDISATIPNSKLPGFLTQDIGISAFQVDENDVFTAEINDSLFDIPISAVGDFGPGDQLSLDVLGFTFRIH